LFTYLHELYGWQYDFHYTLERVLRSLIQSWLERPEALRRLDERREADPEWFQSQEMVGIVLYVDLFSDRLAKLKDHIPYFKKLGLTYLHLMPLFVSPHGENDGGYAVSDYRSINPDLGNIDDLEEVTAALRDEGISVVLDLVFNHTSDEHQWALRAKAGDPDFLAFYFTFPDRELPDQFQRYLRSHAEQRMLVVSNFSEATQASEARCILPWVPEGEARDHLSGQQVALADGLVLEHHRAIWLEV
jgi:amylosucrase